MGQLNSKKIHEKFHEGAALQQKVISNKNFTYRLHIEVINKYLHMPHQNILDIGCGTGTLTFFLAQKGHKITGIDISQNAIDLCKKNAKEIGLNNIRFSQAEFPNISLVKNTFDMIIFTEVIEHIKDDNLAIRRIADLLKPGGILILSTPSVSAPLHKLGLTKNFDKRVGHLRRYSLEELEIKLQNNHLKILETHKIEGVIRNFLFINPIAGKFLRIIKGFLSDWVTWIDTISLNLFGESNYIIIAKK